MIEEKHICFIKIFKISKISKI